MTSAPRPYKPCPREYEPVSFLWPRVPWARRDLAKAKSRLARAAAELGKSTGKLRRHRQLRLPLAHSGAARLATCLVTLAIGFPAGAAERSDIPIDEQLEHRLRDELGDHFEITRSDHFLLAHDTNKTIAQRYLAWTEHAFHDITGFLRACDIPIDTVNKRLVVVCTADWSAYTQLVGADQSDPTIRSGYYDRTTGRTYFGHLSTRHRAPDKKNAVEAAMRLTVRHETFHHVTDAVCPRLSANMPAWLSEGLACAFETPGSDGEAGPSVVNKWRAADFLARFGDAGSAAPEVHRRVEAIELIRNPARWGSHAGLTEPERYAAAWAIVHFLATEHSEAFKKYLRRLAACTEAPDAKTQIDLFQTLFGPADERMARKVHRSAAQAMHANSPP